MKPVYAKIGDETSVTSFRVKKTGKRPLTCPRTNYHKVTSIFKGILEPFRERTIQKPRHSQLSASTWTFFSWKNAEADARSIDGGEATAAP
jgi:hypothetical protein